MSQKMIPQSEVIHLQARLEHAERLLAFARGFLAGLVDRVEGIGCIASYTHCAVETRSLPTDIRAAIEKLSSEVAAPSAVSAPSGEEPFTPTEGLWQPDAIALMNNLIRDEMFTRDELRMLTQRSEQVAHAAGTLVDANIVFTVIRAYNTGE